MDLSTATIEHLRDEAYLFLCREAAEKQLNAITQEKVEIASTRPPFFLFAKKEARNAFTQSMRVVSDNESALRDRLAQISRLEEWLRTVIRGAVVSYLSAVSPDFQKFAAIRDVLDRWENQLPTLAESVVALARELRLLGGEAAAGRGILRELDGARAAEMRMERTLADLDECAAELSARTEAREDVARDVRLPALPAFRREAWVNRLAIMTPEQVVTEAGRAEREARAFLSGGVESARARLEASRAACGRFEDGFVEHYWQQLRVHARVHYVEERDIDVVLDQLSQSYVQAHLRRGQPAHDRDPFLV